MNKGVYVLDASAIIGGFISKKTANFVTASVINEIKDLKSKINLEAALNDGSINIMEPNSSDLTEIENVIMKRDA